MSGLPLGGREQRGAEPGRREPIDARRRGSASRPSHPTAQAWLAVALVVLVVVGLAVASTFGAR